MNVRPAQQHHVLLSEAHDLNVRYALAVAQSVSTMDLVAPLSERMPFLRFSIFDSPITRRLLK
jgi:hypothetical protein